MGCFCSSFFRFPPWVVRFVMFCFVVSFLLLGGAICSISVCRFCEAVVYVMFTTFVLFQRFLFPCFRFFVFCFCLYCVAFPTPIGFGGGAPVIQFSGGYGVPAAFLAGMGLFRSAMESRSDVVSATGASVLVMEESRFSDGCSGGDAFRLRWRREGGAAAFGVEWCGLGQRWCGRRW
ncbi:hypothetical protein QL285_014160 [Trifolium repens]|nr:hypothetical protein QL285_014160 [Trifolium repens]